MPLYSYGQQLAQALHAKRGPLFVSQKALLDASIAVTEVKRTVAANQLTAPVPYDDAFIVALNLTAWPQRALWIDGKPARAQPLQAGMSTIFDLRRRYIGYGASPFHVISFYLPRRALDAIAEIEELRPVDSLDHDPCAGVDDPTIRGLGLSLAAAFDRPAEANLLFVDHVTTALAAHVVGAYGTAPKGRRPRLSRLAPWQEQRSKELLAARLDGTVSIAELARECELPVSTFIVAFAATLGMAPHRWLLRRRVARAMALLRDTARPVDDIAIECGFAGEAHFARVFEHMTRTKPQDWRHAALC